MSIKHLLFTLRFSQFDAKIMEFGAEPPRILCSTSSLVSLPMHMTACSMTDCNGISFLGQYVSTKKVSLGNVSSQRASIVGRFNKHTHQYGDLLLHTGHPFLRHYVSTKIGFNLKACFVKGMHFGSNTFQYHKGSMLRISSCISDPFWGSPFQRNRV